MTWWMSVTPSISGCTTEPTNLLVMGIVISMVSESLWSFTKRRLAKFNGVKANFELHLKECEWRWKKDADTLAKELSKILRKSSAC